MRVVHQPRLYLAARQRHPQGAQIQFVFPSVRSIADPITRREQASRMTVRETNSSRTRSRVGGGAQHRCRAGLRPPLKLHVQFSRMQLSMKAPSGRPPGKYPLALIVRPDRSRSSRCCRPAASIVLLSGKLPLAGMNSSSYGIIATVRLSGCSCRKQHPRPCTAEFEHSWLQV
jgi:hypothetical protein